MSKHSLREREKERKQKIPKSSFLHHPTRISFSMRHTEERTRVIKDKKPTIKNTKRRRRTHQELEQVIAVSFKEVEREKNKRSVCVRFALRFPLAEKNNFPPRKKGRKRERKLARDLSLLSQ